MGSDSSAPPPQGRSRMPDSEAFLSAIMSGWADRREELPDARPASVYAAKRRALLSERFPGQRIIIEAGDLKTRSNDTTYPFRASTAFSYLTGWGADAEPGARLVFNPTPKGHECVLYFRERAGRDSSEFYANTEIGEFWIGPRPSLAQVSQDLAIETAPLDTFAPTPDAELSAETIREIEVALSEMRLIKDEYEISQMREAVLATFGGFNRLLEAVPQAIGHPRGERIIEGAFNAHARLCGNTVGYDTIAAAGSHACILHWTSNNGPVDDGDLILVDAGVELNSLYTADITRTIPVRGEFSPIQRQVYEAVLDAADAAHAVAQPGIRFREMHETAMAVIESRTRDWGFLPNESQPGDEAVHHRRFMVHGTSHHLGMDVHDCAQARREMYMDAELQPGMVFTIEPGLYFQPDDLTVPEEFRGIGVRIEDNVLVTSNGSENLSSYIPRTPDEVEAWVMSAKSLD